MTKEELFSAYVIPLIIALLTAFAGFVGAQIKVLYQKHVDDKTKAAVVRTCVKATEQLYHDLGGPEKLQKAQEGIVQMLNERGIPISELEMNLLIESVVAEFNYAFGKVSEAKPAKLPALDQAVEEPKEYSEEEGASK